MKQGMYGVQFSNNAPDPYAFTSAGFVIIGTLQAIQNLKN